MRTQHKLFMIVVVAVASALLLPGVGNVTAAVPGSGPDTALAPGRGWAPLAVGQQIWYAFQYKGDNSQILVDLQASPSNGATFAIWTPATLASWAAGDDPNPVGYGSSDSYINGGDLVWIGSFNERATYYVVVDHAGSLAGGVLLTVIGSGVSTLPASTMTPTPANTPTATTVPASVAPVAVSAATPMNTPTVTAEKTTGSTELTAVPVVPTAGTTAAAPAVEASASPIVATPAPRGSPTAAVAPVPRPVAAAPGSGPDTALAPGRGWTPLAVGQQIWYGFQYSGDNSQILVDLQASPSNGATFAVWTPATLASWAAGDVPNPVGHGSSDSSVNGGDLVWSGNFNEGATYYVVVDQAGSLAGGIFLKIGGNGVFIGIRSGGQSGGR